MNYIEESDLQRMWSEGDETGMAAAWYLMARGLADKYCHYLSPDDRDDAVQGAVLHAHLQVRKYDPDKGTKIFAYMTTVILNHMRYYAKLERAYYRRICKYQRSVMIKSDMRLSTDL